LSGDGGTAVKKEKRRKNLDVKTRRQFSIGANPPAGKLKKALKRFKAE
jgi:hypothetical protein